MDIGVHLKNIYLFLEKGERKEKEGEKHQHVVASHVPLTRDLAGNPDMCPDPLVHGLALNPLSHTPARANHMYFYKREAEGCLTHTEKR